MSEKKRLIIKVTEADYAPLDDGYLYFWPDPAKGALSADNLRGIADELDRRNAPWDAHVQREVGGRGMSDFHVESVVAAARKQHSCEQCGQPVEVGSPYRRGAGSYDGEMYSHATHIECHEAAQALARLSGAWDEDYPWFRHMDMDREDREWLLKEHPVVAERLGIVAEEASE